MARLSTRRCKRSYRCPAHILSTTSFTRLWKGKAANLVVTFTVCFCLIVLNLMSRFFPLVAFNIWEF